MKQPQELLLEHQEIAPLDTRNMRVAGHYDGDVEAIGIFRSGEWMDTWDSKSKPKVSKKAPKPDQKKAPPIELEEKEKPLDGQNVVGSTGAPGKALDSRNGICKKCEEPFRFIYCGKGRPRAKCDRCV